MRAWLFALPAIAAILAGCPGGMVPAAGGPMGEAGIEEAGQRLLVAGATASVWSGSGGMGTLVATLHQGIVVSASGGGSGEWVRVRTIDPFEVEGTMRGSDLGCRLAQDLPLVASPGAAASDGLPTGKRGCLVRVLEEREGWLRIETATEPFTWYEADPGKGGAVLSHTEHGGYVVEAWIPADRCSADEKKFYPKSPKDGTLVLIEEGSEILSEPGGVAKRLPGKALPWTRWVALGTDGAWGQGRTDGQVVVAGWIQASALGPLPNTNPLNKLAEHQVKDHEVVGSSPLEDGDGTEIAKLPIGTDVFLLAEDSRGCKVRTFPPIEIEGWIECIDVRDVSTLPEAAIDYGMLDGGAMPPDRGPITNPNPWP